MDEDKEEALRKDIWHSRAVDRRVERSRRYGE